MLGIEKKKDKLAKTGDGENSAHDGWEYGLSKNQTRGVFSRRT